MKSINTLRTAFFKNSVGCSFSTLEKRSLEGKRAVVTGSTSGIGLGIARELASNGCSIMFNGFGNLAEINQLKNDFVKQYKVKAEYHPADMTKPTEIADLIDNTISKLGGVDILVNNAGFYLQLVVKY